MDYDTKIQLIQAKFQALSAIFFWLAQLKTLQKTDTEIQIFVDMVKKRMDEMGYNFGELEKSYNNVLDFVEIKKRRTPYVG